MPNPTTHLSLMKKLIKEKPNLFKDIDITYFLSGTVFPDINFYIHTKAGKSLSHYWHRTKKATLNFADKLIKEARTKKEKSFALGFRSHAIMDKYIHKELDDLELFAVNHMLAENFLDTYYKKQIISEHLNYPVKLVIRVLRKEKQNKLAKYAKFNLFHKIKFNLSQAMFKHFIIAKFIDEKKSKKFYILDPLIRAILNKKSFNFVENAEPLICPDFRLKKHMKVLLKAIEKGKKEFVKELTKFNKNLI